MIMFLHRRNFLKGCKWAPDGSCFCTSSADNILRIFNTPPEIIDHALQLEDVDLFPAFDPVLSMPTHSLIYDFCWYPLMNSSNADLCCLFATCKNSPVCLFDAYTGKIRCSYRTFNHLEETVSATSISCDPSGQHLFCGFMNTSIRVFDVSCPDKASIEHRNHSGNQTLLN
ncbi:hypothetical protein GJ496_008663 [Pomphorhynchus laevis]|nr:hypothetical protein GJ496_008663 [Pomphorhynchus laevis]